MKIVHITLHYYDGWGYQDNLLPAYQQRLGDRVTVISENQHLLKNYGEDYANEVIKKGTEYYYEGVKIIKIKCFVNTSNTSLFCKGLYSTLIKEKPDIIFHHGIVGCTLLVSSFYKCLHSKVLLYVDNHADSINMTSSKVWHLLYDKFFLSCVVKLIGKSVDYYLGVSPLRCRYLHETFNIPDSRIGFLPLGCDTFMADSVRDTKDELRQAFNLPLDSFVIISGGKMDRSKGTLSLIEAFSKLKVHYQRLHLLLFGKADVEVIKATNDNKDITLVGWCDRLKTFSLLKLADVACWPLLHTTLIEDSVACSLPLVIKSSGNVSHLKIEKNGVYLNDGDTDELYTALETIFLNYESFHKEAIRVRNKYDYSTIAASINTGLFEKDYHKYE